MTDDAALIVGMRELDPAFYEALGRFTAAWAYVEMGADAVGTVIFHGYDGKSLRPTIPYSLDQKIEYLKKAFKRLPALEKHSEVGRVVVSDLASMRTNRHDVIHGLHGNVDVKGRPISGRLRYVPDNLFMQNRSITTADLRLSAERSLKLTADLLDLCLRLDSELRSRNAVSGCS